MKKALCILLMLAVLAPCALAQVDQAFARYEEYGLITAAEKTENGAVIEAEGYFGYHMDEEPSMTVRVEIGGDGVITAASVVASKAQTPAFSEMITQEYMDGAFVGAAALPLMDVDAVAGATATSQAVRYAVETAANYAQNAYGIVADTHAADKAELNEVFPAAYETIETGYKPSKQKLGSVLYAARGVSESGQSVVAMKVKCAVVLSYKGSAGTGWTASEPSAYTMVIVVDEGTNQVCAWRVLTDGTKRTEHFTVPDEKIDAYKSVVIDGEKVFDDFMDGIVLALEYETEASEEGPVITGTSIVYTGKTEQGTFSSQLVRNCLRTAAAYYCNYDK